MSKLPAPDELNTIVEVQDRTLVHRARMLRRPAFADIFMDFAVALSARSTCRRLRVGCVIASLDHRHVYGVGYNGSAAGGPNDCDGDEPGKCGCFVSGTTVSALGVQRAYRRRYAGDVVRIVTRVGEFTVTPNHPILSLGRGMVPAEALHEGDHLLHPARDEDMAARAPDDHEGMPIEQVYEAVRVAGRVVRRTGASHQFHGDGTSDEDVDVVSTDRGLLDHRAVQGRERLGEQWLAIPGQVKAACRAPRPAFGPTLLGGYPGFVEPRFHDDAGDAEFPRDGVGGLSAMMSRDDVLDVERDHRLAFVPAEVLSRLAQHTTLAQALLNRGVGDVEGRRYVYHPFAGLVSADKVIHVERDRWAGHVYNLQTTSGWYCAGSASTIVQNCVHAEANAVINCSSARQLEKVVYCTNLPCVQCSKYLINLGGVVRVLYRHDYRVRDGLGWLERAGITTQILGEPSFVDVGVV